MTTSPDDDDFDTSWPDEEGDEAANRDPGFARMAEDAKSTKSTVPGLIDPDYDGDPADGLLDAEPEMLADDGDPEDTPEARAMHIVGDDDE